MLHVAPLIVSAWQAPRAFKQPRSFQLSDESGLDRRGGLQLHSTAARVPQRGARAAAGAAGAAGAADQGEPPLGDEGVDRAGLVELPQPRVQRLPEPASADRAEGARAGGVAMARGRACNSSRLPARASCRVAQYAPAARRVNPPRARARGARPRAPAPQMRDAAAAATAAPSVCCCNPTTMQNSPFKTSCGGTCDSAVGHGVELAVGVVGGHPRRGDRSVEERRAARALGVAHAPKHRICCLYPWSGRAVREVIS